MKLLQKLSREFGCRYKSHSSLLLTWLAAQWQEMMNTSTATITIVVYSLLICLQISCVHSPHWKAEFEEKPKWLDQPLKIAEPSDFIHHTRWKSLEIRWTSALDLRFATDNHIGLLDSDHEIGVVLREGGDFIDDLTSYQGVLYAGEYRRSIHSDDVLGYLDSLGATKFEQMLAVFEKGTRIDKVGTEFSAAARFVHASMTYSLSDTPRNARIYVIEDPQKWILIEYREGSSVDGFLFPNGSNKSVFFKLAHRNDRLAIDRAMELLGKLQIRVAQEEGACSHSSIESGGTVESGEEPAAVTD